MNAEIIAVGSELLLGQIVNTNARFLSEQLAEIGVNVFFHTVVGDNNTRLEEAISIAEKRADLIIFTGGLGPTKDDLTKETIAKKLDKNLVLDDDALISIKEYFNKTNRTMTANNEKQALVLESSTVLKNEFGMAPGMFLKTNNHYYMLLPGPPFEMEPMFRKYGKQELLNSLNKTETIHSRVLRFFGIGEAQLETEIMHIIDKQSNPTVAPLASDGEVTLRLTAKHDSKEVANKMLDEVEEEIKHVVGDYFYGYDDTSLMKVCFRLLKDNGITISSAESLTGGLFQSQLTAFSGASSIFQGGVVCYQDKVKQNILSVKETTLKKHSAISEECAIELANNVRDMFSTDIGISFTGVAGPGPSNGKPAGTVWIGISRAGQQTKAFQLNLGGSRNGNRIRAVKYGWYYLIKELSE